SSVSSQSLNQISHLKSMSPESNCQSHRVDSQPKNRRTASFAAIRGGHRSSLAESDIDKAYAQMMRGKRKGA
ncbi:hypothetical protein, partial [Komagataeibacter saccharivorans]|uniref:hypothetical protein n=1 Tax=Komagataeibacter saccharivorans TaxID=265959 RepID=UPI0022317BAE